MHDVTVLPGVQAIHVCDGERCIESVSGIVCQRMMVGCVAQALDAEVIIVTRKRRLAICLLRSWWEAAIEPAHIEQTSRQHLLIRFRSENGITSRRDTPAKTWIDWLPDSRFRR